MARAERVHRPAVARQARGVKTGGSGSKRGVALDVSACHARDLIRIGRHLPETQASIPAEQGGHGGRPYGSLSCVEPTDPGTGERYRFVILDDVAVHPDAAEVCDGVDQDKETRPRASP